MGNLDGRRNFPRLSIGTFLVRLRHDSILCFYMKLSGLLIFGQALVIHQETWIWKLSFFRSLVHRNGDRLMKHSSKGVKLWRLLSSVDSVKESQGLILCRSINSTKYDWKNNIATDWFSIFILLWNNIQVDMITIPAN